MSLHPERVESQKSNLAVVPAEKSHVDLVSLHGGAAAAAKGSEPHLSTLGEKTEKSITDTLKGNSYNIDDVFSQLRNLKSSESAAAFKADLGKINADLEKSGFLPNFQINEDASKKDGFALGTSSSGRQGDAAPKPEAPKNEQKAPEQHAPKTSAPEGGHKQVEHHSGNDSHHAHHGAHHGGHGGHHKHHSHSRHGHNEHGGHAGKGSSGGEGFDSYDGSKAPDEATLGNSVKAVLNEAKAQGLSDTATKAALASMLVESKGNPAAVGDHNTSFGLFQLHQGGELTEALKNGLLNNKQEAFDPAKNVHVALAYFKQHQNEHDPGRLAVEAQRPSERIRSQYAAKVDHMINDGTIDALIKKYGS
jgi:hypothetical protein